MKENISIFNPRNTDAGVGTFYTMLLLGISSVSLTLPFLFISYLRLPERVGNLAAPIYVLLTLVTSLVSFYASIIIIRLLIKLSPVRVTYMRSIYKKTIAYILDELVVLTFPFTILYRFSEHYHDKILLYISNTTEVSANWFNELFRIASMVIPIFILWVFPILYCIIVHENWRNTFGKNFILFLRRFASSSDYIVGRPLLTGINPGVHLVMLVEAEIGRLGPFEIRGNGNWDPLTVGFTGFNLRHPFSSIPLYLRATEETWLATVNMLVERAACVVIDISEASLSISSEIQLLRNPKYQKKAIFLKQSKPSSLAKLNSNFPYEPECLFYSVSWKDAYPRIILEFCMAVAVTFAFLMPFIFTYGWKFINIALLLSLTALFFWAFIMNVIWPSMSLKSIHDFHHLIRSRIHM